VSPEAQVTYYALQRKLEALGVAKLTIEPWHRGLDTRWIVRAEDGDGVGMADVDAPLLSDAITRVLEEIEE
jgi:hypothetical protein